MKRGEVYWADFAPRSGSEQMARRPAIVVSHDGFNETPGWQSVIVVPVSTSSAQRRRGLTAVSLAAGTAGLPVDSVALCHQVTTLDRSKLSDYIGTLPDAHLDAVSDGLKYAQGLS